MNRYVMEEFHNDPALRRRLFGDAHRERARAVHGGLAWLLKRLKSLAPRLHSRPSRWIARLG